MTQHHDDHQQSTPPSASEHRAHWEQRYGSGSVWSGRPNGPLVAVLDTVAGDGRSALDLGCGTGADAVWLAQQGWVVTGVDIAESALHQAAEAAREAEVADRIDWVRADLDQWQPGRQWDLVTASFLHSELVADRTPLLERVLHWVAPGGELVLISHLRAPAWREQEHQHSFRMPTVQEIVAFCDRPGWTVLEARETETDLPSPEGEPGTRVDTVVRVRRHS